MRVYGWAPVTGACHWYRIREPLRALAGRGHVTEFGELFDESVINRADTVVTHLLHDEQASEAWHYLSDTGAHRLVYDIDDNVWAYPDGTEHHEHWTPERLAAVEDNLRLAHLVTTPSSVLAKVVTMKTGIPPENIAVLPNCVPAWALNVKRITPEPFTIGIQFAPQRLHQADLDTIQAELFVVMRVCRDARLLFFGQPHELAGAGPFAKRIDYIPWQTSVPDYYRSLHRMTAGIAPLVRSPFTDCKSSVRAVEYHGMGIPGVYSDVPAYRGWVQHRATGYLVNYSHDWRKQLVKLYRNPDLVERLSESARQQATVWTSEANAHRWEDAYERSGPDASNPSR
jgi:glycosyltransferase involved in cell wall biosynthesis